MENSDDPYMIVCPDCITKIEKTVLSEGLVIPAPNESEITIPIFMKYIEKYKFSEFERYFGMSASYFVEEYVLFTAFVEAYFLGYSSGHEYKKNETKKPFHASISCENKPVFSWSVDENDYVKDKDSINILKEEYFIDATVDSIEFMDCENVMINMLYRYWINQTYF